ncbi:MULTISPECIES: DNA polymerase III subunit delta [Anaerolinea]|uniref:DNA polymerase III subunit delta n=1 Tax=Anaerolinea thermophila (strain DSM 14523 / JCM 11388 / NBRC 100420 / UNI-1) TaxID=926569 RepID=E8N2S0_ANATU|nr:MULTISPECIES: DNA polymerase III subunit delta [Anaerolinea]BAJ65070.1 DNA polymerase III delta subunit [Anaerolinea thermophila UNI-1]
MSEKPVVYVLHGNDVHAMQAFIHTLREKLGDPAVADLNLTRLDGRTASEDDIFNAAGAMPFLAERRLVILTHPFTRLTAESARQRFCQRLETLPETTALVLVIEDIIERRSWVHFPPKHWFRAWMEKAGKRVHYHLCTLPDLSAMPAWIQKEARSLGGQFTAEAAAELARHVGNDTQTARQEIEKLLTYVNFQRAVELEDVAELTAQGGEADLFAMMDAIAEGNARLAQNLLHRLLEEEDELSLFGMIVRQFRLLLLARELLDEGKGVADFLQAGISTSQFVAEKSLRQARRFSMAQLEEIYRTLYEMDGAVKTSNTDLPTALDTFIVALAR